MKKILFLILTLLMCGAAMAQNLQDVVYLKNGSVVRGTLIEQVPDVKIRTADGSIWIFEVDKVERIASEPKVQSSSTLDLTGNQYSNSGLRADNGSSKSSRFSYTDLGRGLRMLMGMTFQQRTSRYACGVFDVDISLGLQLNPKFYVGLGLADQIYFDYWYYGYYDDYPMPVAQLPVFVDFRYDAKPGKFSPMADLRFGYSVTGDELVDYSGMYINPSAGIRIRRFTLSLGAELVKLHDPWIFQEINTSTGNLEETTVTWQSSLQFRLMFEWGGRK